MFSGLKVPQHPKPKILTQVAVMEISALLRHCSAGGSEIIANGSSSPFSGFLHGSCHRL